MHGAYDRICVAMKSAVLEWIKKIIICQEFIKLVLHVAKRKDLSLPLEAKGGMFE